MGKRAEGKYLAPPIFDEEEAALVVSSATDDGWPTSNKRPYWKSKGYSAAARRARSSSQCVERAIRHTIAKPKHIFRKVTGVRFHRQCLFAASPPPYRKRRKNDLSTRYGVALMLFSRDINGIEWAGFTKAVADAKCQTRGRTASRGVYRFKLACTRCRTRHCRRRHRHYLASSLNRPMLGIRAIYRPAAAAAPMIKHGGDSSEKVGGTMMPMPSKMLQTIASNRMSCRL